MSVPQTQLSTKPQDNLGCALDRLDDDRRVDCGGMTFYRKRAASAPAERIRTPANGRGYLLGISFSPGHQRRIFKQNHSTLHSFGQNSVYLRSFQEDYQADVVGSFNFALFEISPVTIERLTDGADLTHIGDLQAKSEPVDPVLAGLMGALFADRNGHAGHSLLFVDQVTQAIGLHVVKRYGSGQQTSRMHGRRLSIRQQSLVRDILRDRMAGDVSIAELASACGLSAGAFLRSFRETMGKTPHGWLMEQRLKQALTLLEASTLSLHEIAELCGFCNQSHFTRSFARMQGVPPGAWRKERLR